MMSLVITLCGALCAVQKQLAQERISALLTDRKLHEAEEARHRAGYNAQVEALANKVQRLEEALRLTTRDYILGEANLVA